MNHLLEAWITWIKYEPYFTVRPNSKHKKIKKKTLKVWGRTRFMERARCVTVRTALSQANIWKHMSRKIGKDWKFNRKWAAKKKVWGDGGSKDNDSYTSGVMCLISLSNSAGWAGEGGSALESAQDECISVSLNTAATCTEHEKIENSVLQVVNKGALTRSGDGNDFFPGEGAKTTEETAGEDRVSNHEKVAKWPEVNRWQRWGGGEGRETSLQEVEGRREQSCNN